jgi:hypothetical protein
MVEILVQEGPNAVIYVYITQASGEYQVALIRIDSPFCLEHEKVNLF